MRSLVCFRETPGACSALSAPKSVMHWANQNLEIQRHADVAKDTGGNFSQKRENPFFKISELHRLS